MRVGIKRSLFAFSATAIVILGWLLVRQWSNACMDACRLYGIHLGLMNYHDRHGHFPPAIISENGKPPYSWRVAILPFMERDDLFKRYRFDEPWDSPANKELLKSTPQDFLSKETGQDGYTNVVAVIDEQSIFPPSGSTREKDITDHRSQTILAVQIPKSDIPWTEPRDISYQQFLAEIRATQSASDRVRIITESCAFGELDPNEDEEVVRALITIAGGDDEKAWLFFKRIYGM